MRSTAQFPLRKSVRLISHLDRIQLFLKIKCGAGQPAYKINAEALT